MIFIIITSTANNVNKKYKSNILFFFLSMLDEIICILLENRLEFVNYTSSRKLEKTCKLYKIYYSEMERNLKIVCPCMITGYFSVLLLFIQY